MKLQNTNVFKEISFGVIAASMLFGCSAGDKRESLISDEAVEKKVDFKDFQDKKKRYEKVSENNKIHVKNRSVNQIFKILNASSNKTNFLMGKDLILPNTSHTVETIDELAHYIAMLTDKRLVKDIESDTIVKWKLVSYENNPFAKNFELNYDGSSVNAKTILKNISQSTSYSLIYNKNVLDAFNEDMKMEFHGNTLNNLVDYISEYYNVNIAVDHKHKTINVSKYNYMVFDIIVPTANLNLDKTMTSGSGGEGFGTGSIKTSSNNNIDIYGELEQYLSLLVKQDPSIINEARDMNENTFFIQRSTGKIFVNADPKTLDKVTEIIDEYKSNLETTISVSVAIYTVELNDGSQYGIDWQAISNSANGFLTAGTSSNLLTINDNNGTPSGNQVSTVLPTDTAAKTGFVGASKITGGGKIGVNGVLSMAGEYGEISDVSKFNISLINNFPVTQVISEKVPYLSEIKNEIVAGKDGANDTIVTTPTFESVDSGIFFYINAKTFKDSDKIMIDMSPQFSKLQGFETIAYGAGESSSQPKTIVETFNNNIVINDGDKVILTGIITDKEEKGYLGMDPSGGGMFKGLDMLTGQSSTARKKKEIFIILEASKNK